MTTPQATTLGTPAPDFALPATDGKTYRLRDIAGGKGAVIAFICNHRPASAEPSIASPRMREC